MKQPFSSFQRRILSACIIIYTLAYLNRLNLSAALASLREVLDITAAQAGLLQTAFAIPYAAGQLVNGALVDRLSPIRHMVIGIVGAAVCNLLMGLIPVYPALVGLCLLNGAFQSMLWTPIVRIFAQYFENAALRKRANILQSLALVVGHLGAWAISGYLSALLSWRYSFIVPALTVIPGLAAAMYLLRGVKLQEHQEEAAAQVQSAPQTPVIPLFVKTGFFFILIVSILHGFIKDGVVTWTPDVLRAIGGGLSATSFSLIIPLVNTIGMLGGYWVQDKARQANRPMLAGILALSALCSLPLLLVKGGMLFTALLLGMICACMYGMNPIMTGLLPMEYEKAGRIGLTAGLIDSFIYLGSSLAGVAAGGLYEALGVKALYAAFLIASAAAAILSWLSALKARGNELLNE